MIEAALKRLNAMKRLEAVVSERLARHLKMHPSDFKKGKTLNVQGIPLVVEYVDRTTIDFQAPPAHKSKVISLLKGKGLQVSDKSGPRVGVLAR